MILLEECSFGSLQRCVKAFFFVVHMGQTDPWRVRVTRASSGRSPRYSRMRTRLIQSPAGHADGGSTATSKKV